MGVRLDYYIDTITEYLNEFLERNEFDCTAKAGLDFQYFYPESLITFSFLVSEKSDREFLTFTKKLFPNIEADIFLWSFLHEVGHHETLDDFNDLEHKVYHHIINQKDIDDNYYYNLPIEKAATVWAGNFMLEQKDEVQRLWNKIQPVLMRLYEQFDF